MIASLAMGMTASVSSNPADVMKTRLMNMRVGPDGVAPYSGQVDYVVKMARNKDYLVLYKGLIPTICKQGSSTIVLFVALEPMRKLLWDTQ